MNRLKKKAWAELVAFGSAMLLISTPCTLAMAKHNTQGLRYVFIALIVGVPAGFFAYLAHLKELKKYDEREMSILRKSYSISSFVFTIILMCLSFTAFLLIGGAGSIRIVYLPMMLFAGLFLAQCAQSFTVLYQCAKEDDAYGPTQ
ncbi:MAG: hypothetical protein ACYSO2_09190 [Planctomycetota bacterium]|jgi:ABC-type methionine transport system permease subunit